MKTFILSAISVLLILLHSPMTAQTYAVNGKITCKTTGEDIRQMSVVERHSGIGTITSENGTFSLILKPGPIDLLLTDESYEPFSTSFVLKSDTTLILDMNPVSFSSTRKIKKELNKQEVHSAFIPDTAPVRMQRK